MTLATINGVDISDKIQSTTYRVDDTDIVDSWVDASEKNHERLYRTRAKGSFELAFISDGTGVNTFRELLQTASNGRTLKITVFINNKCIMKEIDCHYVIEGIKRVELHGGKYYDRLKFTLEEI